MDPDWLQKEIAEIKADVKLLLADHHERRGQGKALSGVGKVALTIITMVTSAIVSVFVSFISKN